ncbi:hypothetical protein HGG64_01325 [Mycoplasma phocoeninasale]|uniref:Uncharacterized protein n=1 Tax=Mycoplasma phocoeninasale TaxID=2726117 RepID=A0A858U1M3_9MOLU|nr:hypothetical protein [Mycoplasma phocoeninasale]QJG66350.1 hypothetical protein HGG64_01325 [Mycoplasma phocoeninasale]
MKKQFRNALLAFNIIAIIVGLINFIILISFIVAFNRAIIDNGSTVPNLFTRLIPVYLLSPLLIVCLVLNVLAMVHAYKEANNLPAAILFGISLFITMLIGILGLIATIILIKAEKKKAKNGGRYSNNMDDMVELHSTKASNEDHENNAQSN